MQRDHHQGLTRREALKRGAVLAGGLAWATPVVQAVGMRPAFAQGVSPFCRTIDFDSDAAGGELDAGDKIGNVSGELQPWSALGINMTSGGNASPAANPLMIFDSGNPTGGDPDLGTPNEDFPGGTGVGSGGEAGQPGENNEARGNVLIISEDGDSSDPDDKAGNGGTIIVTFATAVQITTVGLLDIESPTTNVKAFNAITGGALLTTVNASGHGDNSFEQLDISQSGVQRLEIQLAGSGAVTDFEFCTT